MQPRLFVPTSSPISSGMEMDLSEGVSRHIQVLRMQPGEDVFLFDGRGGQWQARITSMTRKVVSVAVQSHDPQDRELPLSITLAVGMPANDRMDSLIEKATELGAAAIQPLMMERSVLRLSGERAQKKVEHWQAVAVAAAEQCGRTKVPAVHEVQTLSQWLQSPDSHMPVRGVLSLRDASPVSRWATEHLIGNEESRVCFLSGPEGGISPQEEQSLLDAGWTALSLGARVLRADTAPLAAMSVMAAMLER
ncbi:MAG TPA: 16S rRNA (uracil(1498)-N(3))-methyltransferase [Aquabacterium sp.]|nr:16S rRNA (uracil(1498)-N(3))-methyltransferase [Aquabacterium sp.]